jgi:multidrug resistance efflux pump
VAVLERRSIEVDLKAASAALREAEADVEIARLNLADAQAYLDRLEDLSEASKTQREEAQAEHARDVAAQNVKVAEARLEQASARVENLRRLLADCVVRAPFEGAVASIYQQVGAVVGPDVPIARVISHKNLLIRFATPERDSASIAIHSPIMFRSRDERVILRGRVERAAPGIDAASSYRIFEAALDVLAESDQTARIGLEGRVSLATSDDQR